MPAIPSLLLDAPASAECALCELESKPDPPVAALNSLVFAPKLLVRLLESSVAWDRLWVRRT